MLRGGELVGPGGGGVGQARQVGTGVGRVVGAFIQANNTAQKVAFMCWVSSVKNERWTEDNGRVGEKLGKVQEKLK